MIYIDYQGGAHGNFLEYVCNRFIAGIPSGSSPFNQNGASHNRVYFDTPAFRADHFFQGLGHLIKDCQLISVWIEPDDLLRLTPISFLRGGDYQIDTNQLENNTYNKLQRWPSYQSTVDTIYNCFYRDQIRGYNSIRDPSWPDVETVEDFYALPGEIRDECIQVHGLVIRQFDQEHPDCERSVLREFFKIGFANPDNTTFIRVQNQTVWPDSVQQYRFPYSCFYDTQQFIDRIKHLADFLGETVHDQTAMEQIHSEFLKRQPYRNLNCHAKQLFDLIVQGKSADLSRQELMIESYLTARLEKHYGITIDWPHNQWANSADELRQFIREIQQ